MEALLFHLPARILILSLLVIFNFVCNISAQRLPSGHINTNPYWHREFVDSRARYQVEWLVDWDQERVIFNVTVATRGYVGFGLARNSKMEGADIVIGGVSNGTAYFSDRHAIGNQQPILDKSQDWTLHYASESGTHTFLSFSRKFDTCDQNDIPIGDDALYILWAFGERDNEAGEYHSENRGTFLGYLRDPNLAPRSIIEANQIANITGREVVTAQVIGTQVWTIREEFTIPAKRTTYWCNIKKFTPPTQGKKHMIGYNIWIHPDVRPNMHHMLFYRCTPPTGVNPAMVYEQFTSQPGQDCLSLAAPQGPIPTQFCTQLKLGHAIGGKPTFFPQHVGVPLGETNQDEYYLLQVHYDNPEFVRGPIRSLIQMDLYYTENLRENDGTFLSLGHHIPGSPSILLPPGEQEHRFYGHCSPACTRKMLPPEGIHLVGGILHTHVAGRKVRIQHFRDGVELPWILNDDNFKFSFQPNRLLREDLTVLPGDQVSVQCYYDTTSTNTTTVGGYGTDQEMCKTFLLYHSPLVNYPICRSQIQSTEYMMRYLAGTTNVTWSNDRIEFIATAPSRVAGMTLSEISDSFSVNWDSELRNELRRDHIVHPQVDVCPSIQEAATGEVSSPPPGFVTFPVQAKEYQPPERCSLNS